MIRKFTILINITNKNRYNRDDKADKVVDDKKQGIYRIISYNDDINGDRIHFRFRGRTVGRHGVSDPYFFR